MDGRDRTEDQRLPGQEHAADVPTGPTDGDDDKITAMVRGWPPLTESQRERLALLLR